MSISGYLASLYRISINAKRKSEIFQYPSFKDALFELIYNGNDAEKQLSLELLIQLSYDKSIFEEIKNDNKLVEFIRKLSKSENVTYKKVLKTSDQFLWLFEKDKKTISLNESHLMISYNSASRELCLKIKEFLESKNFKVWIDVDEIHGSSLDSMAKAVEDAKIVLMCVTEKYRQSTNCQSEAQYAFRLNKKIIPCIMEKGYSSVTGWLGIIIGDKIFIDFTKYELNDCFTRVLDQISRFEKHSQHNLQKSESITLKPEQKSEVITLKPEKKSEIVNVKKPTELPNQKNFVSWNENETEKWFSDNSLSNVFNILKPINGKYLLQLYQLQIHTPEFFYKSLTSYNSVNIKDVIQFGVIIKELFE
ncbi:unnamed protein product [Brachionus calyciflorus]|uniref:TIR domain-containing protein n=1 Tax=Brachionus calyciflorus TaxID=104777 RepID=A0A813PIE1_9BILA|nr:unnamed protein product [Brachionus calyciflorus]